MFQPPHPSGWRSARQITYALGQSREGTGDSGATNGDPRPLLLEVRGLVKDFPVRQGALLRRKTGHVSAVAGVLFTVRQGENFGLVGESGSGKTTIGRIIACIEKPTSGGVRFDGVELTSLSGLALRRRRRDFQLMFQDPYSSLDPRMSVGATLREPLIIQGIGDRRAQLGACGASARRGRLASGRNALLTRTSSRAASGSGSAWPERSPWSRG